MSCPAITWNNVSGAQLFVGLDPQRMLYPLHTGKTASLADRLASRERCAEAARLGASQTHAKLIPLLDTHARVEVTLIR